jgi:hypothetical protein
MSNSCVPDNPDVQYTPQSLLLLQKQFVVSADNQSLMPDIGSDILCVIQKLTIFYVG